MTGVWVVVPAFNEGRVIGNTISALRLKFENIVVVDDCSRDETARVATEAGAWVCSHPINLGQGAALATGIAFALSRAANAIVTFDADGQHSVDDAERFVKLLFERKADVVLGSRFLGSAINITRGKRAFLRLATAFTRITTGLKVTDTHNGLRCLSRHAAQTIRLRQNRMAHASEMLHEIADARLSMIEAPCTITYTDYSTAKGQPMVGGLAIVFDLFLRSLYR